MLDGDQNVVRKSIKQQFLIKCEKQPKIAWFPWNRDIIMCWKLTVTDKLHSKLKLRKRLYTYIKIGDYIDYEHKKNCRSLVL
jgi:hypothetical protein